MRNRLYQTLPEHSKLIDSVHFACKEKTKKRLYAENIAKDHDVKAVEATEYIESITKFYTLAAGQLDNLYALYDCYEKECIKIRRAMYANLNHSASTSAKFVDWYIRTGKAAWERGFSVACSPSFWTR
ncbi:MAG: hypothetical protein HKP41_03315 [Desulfobacterales bacterium]|nr:hypothetical protein [Deltaproteobacteria bacterium]NNK93359.1 hypothetical protein [Desulfobacterales bacterium]